MFRIGEAEIRRVEEARHSVPITHLIGDERLDPAERAWLAPAFLDRKRDTFEMIFQSWLVRIDGLVLVVDPCNGNGRVRPGFDFFSNLATPYIERFAATGIDPEDVDIVFCTHLHCDHCGWNTRLRDGKWVPTFPNARYKLVRREVDRWNPRKPGHRPIGYNVGVFEESVRPILDAGLADLVDPEDCLSAGLRIEAAFGHTDGHCTLSLASAGEQAIFTGDAFHHPLQVLRPELHLEGCDDLAGAVATRKRLCARLAQRGALMIPAHFPEPHAGHVRKEGGGFRFAPLAHADHPNGD